MPSQRVGACGQAVAGISSLVALVDVSTPSTVGAKTAWALAGAVVTVVVGALDRVFAVGYSNARVCRFALSVAFLEPGIAFTRVGIIHSHATAVWTADNATASTVVVIGSNIHFASIVCAAVAVGPAKFTLNLALSFDTANYGAVVPARSSTRAAVVRIRLQISAARIGGSRKTRGQVVDRCD